MKIVTSELYDSLYLFHWLCDSLTMSPLDCMSLFGDWLDPCNRWILEFMCKTLLCYQILVCYTLQFQLHNTLLRPQYKPWRGITWLAIRWRAQLYVLVWYESQDLFTNFSNAKGDLNFGCWSRLIQGYKNRLSASLVDDHSLVGVLSSNYSNTWIPAYSDGTSTTVYFA